MFLNCFVYCSVMYCVALCFGFILFPFDLQSFGFICFPIYLEYGVYCIVLYIVV